MRTLTKMLVMGALVSAAVVPAAAEKLVMLHTNDTHSQIDPFEEDNLGGVARRKVLIDSVRANEEHVLLIDAGDAVQGSLFFTLFGGEVEERMLNALGYDIRILGNHEFDNGIDSIAAWMRMSDADLIATNYDVRNSRLNGLFKPYTIKNVGGRRIGFIGINRDPEGLARVGTYETVKYTDAIPAANAAAWWLKNVEHCDVVVAVTHIGYKVSDDIDDVTLAKSSRDIDVIIGGHSHTTIDPATDEGRKMGHVVNAAGDTVLIAQTGKGARNLGVVEIDLETLKPTSRLLTVDKRLDSRVNADLVAALDSYREGVDSLNAVRVGTSAVPLKQGSPELLNYVTDFVLERGRELVPDVDMAMMNRGGLRRSLPKGDISEGQIIMMMPFYNYIDVIEISGADLQDAFDVTAAFGGQGVSSNVRATVNTTTKKATDITINGEPLDPTRTYRLATIDYLSSGGDYMKPFTRGTKVAQSPNVIYNDLMDYMRRSNKKINPSGERRVKVVK
ncbi:MAG: bifunctional metallophosphatase/5'-nucleotidase [Muribaculaceae bacterium]|nr:bifunctional metallophosphatase/5'-nucleotidase [Muribaculaceae bacterium]